MDTQDNRNSFHVTLADAQFRKLSTSRLALILGFVISIITAGIAMTALFVSYLQLDVYKQQLEATRQQIKDANDQNKRINDASKTALDKSDEQERKQERAYVENTDFNIPTVKQPNGFIIHFVAKNFGRTKGKELSMDFDREVVFKNRDNIYDIKRNWPARTRTEFDAHPSVTINFDREIYLSDPEKEHLKNIDYVFIYYGKVYYRDIYDIDHETHFCYFVNQNDMNLLWTKNEFEPSRLVACSNFNSGD